MLEGVTPGNSTGTERKNKRKKETNKMFLNFFLKLLIIGSS